MSSESISAHVELRTVEDVVALFKNGIPDEADLRRDDFRIMRLLHARLMLPELSDSDREETLGWLLNCSFDPPPRDSLPADFCDELMETILRALERNADPSYTHSRTTLSHGAAILLRLGYVNETIAIRSARVFLDDPRVAVQYQLHYCMMLILTVAPLVQSVVPEIMTRARVFCMERVNPPPFQLMGSVTMLTGVHALLPQFPDAVLDFALDLAEGPCAKALSDTVAKVFMEITSPLDVPLGSDRDSSEDVASIAARRNMMRQSERTLPTFFRLLENPYMPEPSVRRVLLALFDDSVERQRKERLEQSDTLP